MSDMLPVNQVIEMLKELKPGCTCEAHEGCLWIISPEGYHEMDLIFSHGEFWT